MQYLKKLNSLSENKKGMLNIVACIFVVFINVCINVFLSPFIVKTLGVEANGFITLANNFVSYFGLITTALNSMCGRFILINLKRKEIQDANEFYTSVLVGNYIIAILFFIPILFFVFHIDYFLTIRPEILLDIKILFFITFLTFFIGLWLPQWSCATYVTNNLYLRSLKTIVSTLVRVIVIIFSFNFFKPAAYFVAVAGLLMTITNLIIEFYYKKNLLPELKINKKYVNFKKIMILISSGIWNSINKCGNLLLEGLDLLIANIFINDTAMGVLTLSKVIPNMMNQICGNVSTTFGPILASMYADGQWEEMVTKVKNQMKIITVISTIPIGVTFIYGESFFKLWVPTQDAHQLAILSSLTLIGILITSISSCILNIFIAVNKLKINSMIIITSGFINLIIVYILLKTTNYGVFIIAAVSSFIAYIREFGFTSVYAAKCLKQKPFVFHGTMIKSIICTCIPMFISLLTMKVMLPNGWISFFISVFIAAAISLLIELFVVLDKIQRKYFLKKFLKLNV